MTIFFNLNFFLFFFGFLKSHQPTTIIEIIVERGGDDNFSRLADNISVPGAEGHALPDRYSYASQQQGIPGARYSQRKSSETHTKCIDDSGYCFAGPIHLLSIALGG